MNLHKLIFTENACYKAGRKITPKGIMVHSTGANNPTLKRYVGPDDGLLGENIYNNHWNQTMDRNVCVHGFIGKLKDGTVATYQTLPWDHRGWHAGAGSNGSANDTHISFEICEDGLTDEGYLDTVYQEAAELCAYLCKLYGLDPLKDGVLIDHREGHARGLASNHGDVAHWWPKFGKSMDTFRAYVAELLRKSEEIPPLQPNAPQIVKAKEPARFFLERNAGTYTVAAASMPIRHGAGITKEKMITVPKGAQVQCYGFYSMNWGTKWLYIQFADQGVTYEGFASSRHLQKI